MADTYDWLGDSSTFYGAPSDSAGSGINWEQVAGWGTQLYNATQAGNNASNSASQLLANRGSSSSDSYGYKFGENSSQISAEGRAARAVGYEALTPLFTNNQYSRANALADVEGGVKELFRQFSISDLPKIYNGMVGSGGYNSTSAQLLANEAFANTVAKGQALRTNAITQYAQARAAELAPLVSLLSSDREAFGMDMSEESSTTRQVSGVDGSALVSANKASAQADEAQIQAGAGLAASLLDSNRRR